MLENIPEASHNTRAAAMIDAEMKLFGIVVYLGGEWHSRAWLWSIQAWRDKSCDLVDENTFSDRFQTTTTTIIERFLAQLQAKLPLLFDSRPGAPQEPASCIAPIN